MLPLLLALLPVAPGQRVDQKTVESALTEALANHKVPALGAIVLTPDGEAGAVVGVRKRGSDAKATLADQWHIGSDSKAMTAMLLAVLVNKKLVRYDSTLAEVFPELAGKMHDDFKPVTVEQLLRHRSGLPANLPTTWHLFPPRGPTDQQRERATKMLLAAKPAYPPGNKFEYSNCGYTVAGHVVEKVGKATWEALIKQHVFDPLGMKSAGFGAPGDAAKLDQPWPHDSAGKPVKPGPGADNPEVIGPAGRVHLSLGDWAKFVRDTMRGAEGKDGLLPAGAYKKLVEPAGGEKYTAGGWGRGESPRGYALLHDGSNTMNHCTALVVPKTGVAILVVCNQGGDAGQKATHEVRKTVARVLFAKK